VITSGSMSTAELAERVAAMLPLDLLGTCLLRDSCAGRTPTRDAIVEATNQAVAYRQTCNEHAALLVALAPVPLIHELDFNL
jgi:hypothetical protein